MKKIMLILAILSLTLSQCSYSMSKQERRELRQEILQTRAEYEESYDIIGDDDDSYDDSILENCFHAIYDPVSSFLYSYLSTTKKTYKEPVREDFRSEEEYFRSVKAKCEDFRIKLSKITPGKSPSASRSHIRFTPDKSNSGYSPGGSTCDNPEYDPK